MLTAEQLQKIEQEVREFNESTMSGMCLPVSGDDAAELVKMARRYAWLKERYVAVNFDYQDSGKTVLVFEYPSGLQAWNNLDEMIGEAIAGERDEGNTFRSHRR